MLASRAPQVRRARGDTAGAKEALTKSIELYRNQPTKPGPVQEGKRLLYNIRGPESLHRKWYGTLLIYIRRLCQSHP
jgi:hypothetical protein